MSVSGLVITLSESPSERAWALAGLRSRSDLQLGELSERWLPVVLEKSDDESAEAVFREISLLPGVEYVDVVFVQFEDGRVRGGMTRGPDETNRSREAPCGQATTRE